MHRKHVAKGRGRTAAGAKGRGKTIAQPVERETGAVFEIGEVVQLKFEGRWKDGVVTSVSPLLVRYRNLPDDEGTHHDRVRKKKHDDDDDDDDSIFIDDGSTESTVEELEREAAELERLEEAAEELWLQQEKAHHAQVQQLQERYREAQNTLRESHEAAHAAILEERSQRQERGPYWSRRVLELHHAQRQLEKSGELKQAKHANQRVCKIEAEERYKFMWSLMKECKVKEENLLVAKEREQESLHQHFKKQLCRLLLAQEEQQLNLARKVENLTLAASRRRLQKQLRDLGAKPEGAMAPWSRAQYAEPLAPQNRALRSTRSRPVLVSSSNTGRSPSRRSPRSSPKRRPVWSPVWNPSANNGEMSASSSSSPVRRLAKGKPFEGTWTSPGPLPGWNSEKPQRRGPKQWPGASSNAFWESLEKSAVTETCWGSSPRTGSKQLGGNEQEIPIESEGESCSIAVELDNVADHEDEALQWVPEWQRRREREETDAYFILRGEPVPGEREKSQASEFHDHWSSALRNGMGQDRSLLRAQRPVRSTTPTRRR